MTNANVELDNKIVDKKRVSEYLDEFFYSNAYPVVMMIVAIFCYVTKMQLGGIALVFTIGGYLLVTKRDATPILPLLLFFIFMFRDLSITGSIVFYAMIVPVAVCLVIHFVRFPLKFFNVGKLFLPLCLVTIAMFMGGVLSPYQINYAAGLLYVIPLGPVLLLVYLYFANYIAYPEDFDIKKYICLLLMLMGFISATETAYYTYNYSVLQNNVFGLKELGWSNINTAANVLIIAIPATCYLLTESKNYFAYLLAVLLFYFSIFLTGSDGCLAISLAFLPILAFYTYKHINGVKNKKSFNFIIFLAISGVLSLLVAIYVLGKQSLIYELLSKVSSADSGRTQLYKDAWIIFKTSPLFGAGFGYHNHYLYSPIGGGGLRLFNFHSTLFQVMGSMGIAGILAYVFYFYQRYSVLTERNDKYHLFAFLSFTIAECYGFIDTLEFSTIPLMITLTLLILITEFCNTEPPDLTINKKLY